MSDSNRGSLGTYLATILSVVLLIALLGPLGFHSFEYGVNQNVKGFPDSLWWTLVTIRTIGYGDIFPVTAGGRVIALFLWRANHPGRRDRGRDADSGARTGGALRHRRLRRRRRQRRGHGRRPELAGEERRHTLTCAMPIEDPELWFLLRQREIATTGPFRLQFFNVFDLGARALLEAHPPFPAERRAQGWNYGPRDPERKTNPILVEWDELPEESKAQNREVILGLPQSLARAGFQIYRTRPL
jgi:hypothetical protein